MNILAQHPAGGKPPTDHFREWGARCREHGDYLAGIGGVDRAEPLGCLCPDCDQDRWFVLATPDDDEWSAMRYCTCCGFSSPDWRDDG